jgi:hypothetical protein
MTIRNLVTPVLVLGLSGAAIYYSPCLNGDCGQSTVAESEDAATPCAGDKAKANTPAPEALAAVEEDAAEEPCHYGKEGVTDKALAEVDEEDPCPYAEAAKQEAIELAAAQEPKVAAQADPKEPRS